MNYGNAQADNAAINNAILSDGSTTGADMTTPIGKGQIWPGAWIFDGQLFIPNRGMLKVFPGDWVGVDSQGWPILVSANSIANAAWTHS
jgi:hypothetical protein